MYYYGARWYDTLTHFVQPDSIIPDPYNPLDWNRYAYARNNPVIYIDPDGRRPCGDGVNEDCDGIQRNNRVQFGIYRACFRKNSPDCWGGNVKWIRVDLKIAQNRYGYNPGAAWVPVHTDVNYSVQVGYDKSTGKPVYDRRAAQNYIANANLLFDWEGAALVTYSEHRQLYEFPGWDDAAYGILDTMYNRMANDEKWAWPDYSTLNEASFSSYAVPQLPEYLKRNEVRFKDFMALTVSWFYLISGERLPYDFMVHREGGLTCFGYYAGNHPYCIP